MVVIWKWRHNIHDGAQQWSTATTTTYLTSVLRSSTRGLLERLPRDPRLRDPRLRDPRLRDPRRQLLRALSCAFDSLDTIEAVGAEALAIERTIVFFDGGSRGNPGPGGSGSVLVAMDEDATSARVVWSACMAYSQCDMTNNQAEYLGLITGLREALARGWQPEVVGDSHLILSQLRQYRPPRNAKLRPLYTAARRLADSIGVKVWQHHVRAYNKMTDAAANVAMDIRASVQVSHPSARPHTAEIDNHLSTDLQEWHTRHLLRTAQF